MGDGRDGDGDGDASVPRGSVVVDLGSARPAAPRRSPSAFCRWSARAVDRGRFPWGQIRQNPSPIRPGPPCSAEFQIRKQQHRAGRRPSPSPRHSLLFCHLDPPTPGAHSATPKSQLAAQLVLSIWYDSPPPRANLPHRPVFLSPLPPRSHSAPAPARRGSLGKACFAASPALPRCTVPGPHGTPSILTCAGRERVVT